MKRFFKGAIIFVQICFYCFVVAMLALALVTLPEDFFE